MKLVSSHEINSHEINSTCNSQIQYVKWSLVDQSILSLDGLINLMWSRPTVYASTCTVSQTVNSHRKCTLRIIGYSISSLTSFSFCFIFFNIDMSPIPTPSADSALSLDVPVWYEVVRVKGCSSSLIDFYNSRCKRYYRGWHIL